MAKESRRAFEVTSQYNEYMKIGFDASDLCTGRADGTTRYTEELASRLPNIASEHDMHFMAPCDRVRCEGGVWHASPFPKYWTQLRMPFDLFRVKPDVLFMPIQQLPIFRPRKMKTVAVVHDLAVHYDPEQFTYKDWLLLHTFSAQAAREADQLICVSQDTANDVAKYYGRTENVHVVHHGVDHDRFYVPSDEDRAQSLVNIQKEFPKLRKPYLLFVGQIQPRKNIVRLVEAFEKIHETNKELQLVIAGGHGWLQQPIFDRVAASSAREAIYMTGSVPNALLAPLYWNAELYILPSLFEGFGMPILEAMASGCPVVTSNVSSMPEVAGGSAVLVDPNEVDSIVSGIQSGLREKESLIEKGIARAKQFTWENTARQTLDVILSASRM